MERLPVTWRDLSKRLLFSSAFALITLATPALVAAGVPETTGADATGQLQALTEKARQLRDAGQPDDAILLLQRNLASLAERQPQRLQLAEAIELLGTLAAQKAALLAKSPESRAQARNLYDIAGELYGRALGERELIGPGQDEDIGRLYWHMHQLSRMMRELPSSGGETAAPRETGASGLGSLGTASGQAAKQGEKPSDRVAADASGGVTFCVLRCDPDVPADQATMDPVDIRNLRKAWGLLVAGALSQEGGLKLLRARKKREAQAAAYAAKMGLPPLQPRSTNSVVTGGPWSDVQHTTPRPEPTASGASVGLALSSTSYDAARRPDWGSTATSTPSEEERKRKEAEEQARLAAERVRLRVRLAEMEQAQRQEEAEARMKPSTASRSHTASSQSPSSKASSKSGVTYQHKTTYEFPGDTIEGNLERPVFRYPTIEAPDAIAPETEFAVQVSLTEEQETPEARVLSGETTQEGKLKLNLPENPEGTWKLDAVLSAPGFELARGSSNTATIVLPARGDSTVALFWLRARRAEAAEHTSRILVTFWHQGVYLAKVVREITIRPNLMAAQDAAPPVAKAKLARGEPLPLDDFAPADLTVYWLEGEGDQSEIIINSPFLQPAHYKVPRSARLNEWLALQYRELARKSLRFPAADDAQAKSQEAARRARQAEFLRGFGRELYLRFAPPPFREAFWKLEERLGASFKTIQVFTDNPDLPWELLRPVRADGTGERDFLGLEFSVARWHISQDTSQLDRPPQWEPMEKLVVIAPHYSEERALPAQGVERQALEKLPGYSAVPGRMDSLRVFFQDLPQGIIHFTGHGEVQREGASNVEYAIALEDGNLDLMTWRGMSPVRQKNHPVFFFNACEVGEAQSVASFVEGWAPAVLRTGASGYIGALWLVDDRTAAAFATRFYGKFDKKLEAGPVRVSDVLTETRRELFRETGDPTALAYVFYGDPNLRFIRRP